MRYARLSPATPNAARAATSRLCVFHANRAAARYDRASSSIWSNSWTSMTPDAVADRSVELDDRVMISFMETPMPLANAAMEYWTIETLSPHRSNPAIIAEAKHGRRHEENRC